MDTGEQERAMIVAWLRHGDPWHGLHPDTANCIARKIERGEHVRENITPESET